MVEEEEVVAGEEIVVKEVVAEEAPDEVNNNLYMLYAYDANLKFFLWSFIYFFLSECYVNEYLVIYNEISYDLV